MEDPTSVVALLNVAGMREGWRVGLREGRGGGEELHTYMLAASDSLAGSKAILNQALLYGL